ncbi:hypothetical protein LXL04_000145 [Taraxacum kok-saghyz]
MTGKDKENEGEGSKNNNYNNEKGGLDLDNPLVLHSNDLSCISIVSFKLQGTTNDLNCISIVSFKLQGTTNYKAWSSATELSLRARNKLVFVNGKFPRPTEDELKIRHYKKKAE